MSKRTRSNPLLRKPYEYTAPEDRLHMPRGLIVPHVRGQHPLITLRQYGRTQPTIKRDWNRATITVVRGSECSNHRVWIRLRNRARARLRLLDPTRDWSDDILAEALRTVEAAGRIELPDPEPLMNWSRSRVENDKRGLLDFYKEAQ